MRCFRCQAENAEGSRFCGNCGGSMGTIPPGVNESALTDPTRNMPAQSPPPMSDMVPALSRGGRLAIGDGGGGGRGGGAGGSLSGDSLDGSLRLPVSTGARAVKVALIVVLDLAMVGIGLALLWPSGGGEKSGKAAEVRAVDGGATGPDGGVVVVDAGAVGGGGGSGGAVRGSGSGTAGTGTGTGSGTGTRPGTGTGTGTIRPDAGAPTGTGTIDAREVDPLDPPGPVDAAVKPVPDAGTGPGPEVDAGEPSPTADDIANQVSVNMSRSQSRLSRCYTQATKPLPEDQPLSGEVDIAFEVMPTGETRSVQVVRNTTGSNTLASCISGVVSDWGFDKFDGEALDFQRTFRFRPAG